MSMNGLSALPASFGNVSIGKNTAMIGVVIDRSHLAITKADKLLCGKRITARLTLQNKDEHPDQQRLPGIDANEEMNGIADVKRFSVTTKQIGCGLTFALASIDIDRLCHLAKRAGVLRVEEVEDIPEEESGGDSDDGHEAEEDIAAPRRPRRTAPAIDAEEDYSWRSVGIAEAMPSLIETLVKKLADAEIECLGDLADWTKDGRRQITDIRGIGPGNAAKIEEAMTAFWSQRKQAAAAIAETAEAMDLPDEGADGE